MLKDMRRADRRWRSYCKFLRRLKLDWNQHGWNWGPRWYDRGYQLTPAASCSFWAKTDLCECFYDAKQQARFKDTPKHCACWSCRNPRRANAGKNSTALTFAEHRAFLDDREDWHKRRRRDGYRTIKSNCTRCGVMMGKGISRFHGRDLGYSPGSMCKLCREAVTKVTYYWFNGRYTEFNKPA